MSKRVYNIRRIFIALISFCLFCVQTTFAQLPAVKTSVDKHKILIGQQLNYQVNASMPDNTYRLGWFSIPDSFGNFVVVSTGKIDTSVFNGNLNFSQQITLTNFDSGRRVIPPLALTVATLEGDSTFNIYTDSMVVNVGYSPLDSIEPFHDIKTIMEVKKAWPWWIWALLALAIILLIGWIIFLIKYFKKKKDTTILFTSKLSPFDEAMQSLSELEKQKPQDNKQIKEFHSRLTEIFKRYLSRMANAYKLHLTTDEILIEISEYNLSKEQLAEFANCLRMGNAVKFAQYIPAVYENEKCLSQTRVVVIDIDSLVNKKPENAL